MQEMQVQSLGWEDSLEEEMETHSSILAWRKPWTEEPGGLQSTGSQSRTLLRTQTHTFISAVIWAVSFLRSSRLDHIVSAGSCSV